jgi:hypothetical protein
MKGKKIIKFSVNILTKSFYPSQDPPLMVGLALEGIFSADFVSINLYLFNIVEIRKIMIPHIIRYKQDKGVKLNHLPPFLTVFIFEFKNGC